MLGQFVSTLFESGKALLKVNQVAIGAWGLSYLLKIHCLRIQIYQ